MAIISTLQLLPILVAATLVAAAAPQHLPTTAAAAADNRTLAGFSLRLEAIHDAHDAGMVPNATAGVRETVRPLVAKPINYAYIVSVRFGKGSGSKDYKLALSTSGSLTWMRCKPCQPALRQYGELYDPRSSGSYRQVAGADPACAPATYGVRPASDGRCAFQIPPAQGTLGREFLSLGSSAPFSDFVVGCAATTAARFRNYDTFAGVLGLGRPGPASLLRQIAGRVDSSRFSYCLFAPELAQQARFGYIRFGADVPADNGPVRYAQTPILQPRATGEPAYFVKLVGVSVNGARIPAVTADMFARRADGTGGCVLDAGLPLSWLAAEAFAHVQAAVARFVQHWGGVRVQRDDYALCFRRTPQVAAHVPELTLHFDGGADLHLQGKQVLLNVRAANRDDMCFVMMPPRENRRTVIGAMQQVNTRFVFDLNAGKVSFRPERCHLDRASVPASLLNLNGA